MEILAHAWDELHRLVDKGIVTKVDTLAACKQHLAGEDPVVSKFGMIEKKLGSVVVKRRLILDANESGITQCGRKNERIMLPSVIDVTQGRAESAGTDGIIILF